MILDVGGLLWIFVDYRGFPNEIDLTMPSIWLLICAKGQILVQSGGSRTRFANRLDFFSITYCTLKDIKPEGPNHNKLASHACGSIILCV
jgi:hypothetical protein